MKCAPAPRFELTSEFSNKELSMATALIKGYKGKFSCTLDSGTGSVSIFGINEDGSLTNLGEPGGLSAAAGSNGIAAN